MVKTIQDIRVQVVQIVASVLNIDAQKVTDDTSFESLGADSLDMLELVMKIEEAFNIQIPDDAVEHITTVGQAVHAIAQAQN